MREVFTVELLRESRYQACCPIEWLFTGSPGSVTVPRRVVDKLIPVTCGRDGATNARPKGLGDKRVLTSTIAKN